MRCRVAVAVLALLVLAPVGEARKIEVDDDPVRGDEAAPLVLVEFGDLQCPACYGFVQKTLPRLTAEYVDTGKLRMVYADFPLSIHSEAFAAAVAAQCAGRQGKFWEYHDEIFGHLRYRPQDFTGYADALGLDRAAFDACLEDEAVEKAIHADVRQARKLGINSTPSFVLARPRPGGGKLQVLEVIRGAKPFATFQAAIDAHLNEP